MSPKTTTGNTRPLETSLDEIQRKTSQESGNVSVSDVMEALRYRSYGPFILFPALIEISPLGGIPGLPTVMAAIVALFAVQILAGRESFWLPRVLSKRNISSERLHKTLKYLQPAARKLDKWFGNRLTVFTHKTSVRVAVSVCVLLCLAIPPLELVPFAASIPMIGVALFALGMMLDDGLLMLGGYAFSVGTVVFGLMTFS